MDELKGLRDLVEQLEKESAKEEPCREAQIKTLQKIGAELINEYVIKVGDLTIEPMLVEAYYYHPGKFEDESVYSAREAKGKDAKAVQYAQSRQQQNAGKLFIHFNDWGIDVCLTGSNKYYLSYLIKNALVNGKWETQRQIGLDVCKKCSKYDKCKDILECQYNKTVVLKSCARQKRDIIFVPRVNISNRDFLAALPLDFYLNQTYKFTMPKGCGKQWRYSVGALLQTAGENEARANAEKANGGKIEQAYWDLAKQTVKDIIGKRGDLICSTFHPF